MKSIFIAILLTMLLVYPTYGQDRECTPSVAFSKITTCKKLNALEDQQKRILHNQKTIAEMLHITFLGTQTHFTRDKYKEMEDKLKSIYK